MSLSVADAFWFNDRLRRELRCIFNLSVNNILKANPKAILKKAVSQK